MNQKYTDTREHLVINVCKDDTEIDTINRVLDEVIALYQWHYQVAPYKAKRDAVDSAIRAVRKTIQLLNDVGQYTLAEEVEAVLLDETIATENTVLSTVKQHMKKECLKRGISQSRYKNEFAVLLEEAFKEHCIKYKLNEAPEHFDSNFDPQIN